jgi:C1A family cysteine protease
MKFTLAAATLAATASAMSEEASTMLAMTSFESFKTTHGKTYSEDEHDKRFGIFQANLEKIAAKNAALAEAGEDQVHGITRFADLTEDEFQFFLGVDANIKAPKMEIFSGETVNATSGSYNLADDNLLTAVKDQEQCGSCWAFSATETIETAWIKAGNKMTEFSPQQIVSCDSKDAGCNGGLPTQAFDYVKGAGGMASSSAYPYTSGTGTTGTCDSAKESATVGGTVSSWAYAQDACQGFSACKEDTDAIAGVLKAHGGISIAIDASEWSSYTGGVMTSTSCSSSPRKMDHAVQLVGYNADADVPYWIVRNSWNTSWGNDGFIYLKMGENTCGIANLAAYIDSI